MKKILLSMVMVIFAVVSVNAFSGSKITGNLQQKINSFNKLCPAKTHIGNIDNVKLVGNTVYITESVNSSFPFDIYNKQAVKAKKISIIELYLYAYYDNTMTLFRSLIDSNRDISIKYEGIYDNREAKCFLKRSEINKWSSLRKYDFPKLAILSQVTTNNLKCPANTGNGITINGVHFNGKDVVYEMGIDEDELYFETAKENSNAMREYMISSLKESKYSPQSAAFIGYMKECGCGWIYNYTGNKSNNTFSFRIDLTDF